MMGTCYVNERHKLELMGDAYILIYRYWAIFYSSKGKKYYKGGEACTPVTENNVQADDKSGKEDEGVPAKTAERLKKKPVLENIVQSG